MATVRGAEPTDRAIIKEPVCFACQHLIYWPYCEAYPDGIPDAIRLAKSDHKEPMEGDHGIQFESPEVGNVAEKGGPGSGYHAPHEGLTGTHGGSAPRGAGAGTQEGGLTFTIKEPGRGRVPRTMIRGWTGKRRKAAAKAMQDFNGGIGVGLVIAEDKGETTGIASVQTHRMRPGRGAGPEGSRYVQVRWLGTKRRGYGRQMMDEIAAYAASKGQGVSLGASTSARGFYEKIGMTEVTPGKGVFYWTPQEVQERAGRKAVDDLSELEPEDGVFTTGPIENEVKGIIIEGKTWADVYFQAVEVAEWASVGAPVEAVFTEDGQAVRVKGITLGEVLDVGKAAGIAFWTGYAGKGGFTPETVPDTRTAAGA